MENKLQCPYELIYNSFSIIQLQTFCSEKLEVQVNPDASDNEKFVDYCTDSIDSQIFTIPQDFYTRYILKGFDVRIDIEYTNDEDETRESLERNTLQGHVHVRAIKFFDNCMQLSYRFVVVEDGKTANNDFCKIDHPYTTNQLIITAGIVQNVENWATDENGIQRIDGAVKKITISNLHLDEHSNYSRYPSGEEVHSLEEVMLRYRYYFDKAVKEPHNRAGLHTFIDVCDNLEHTGPVSFSSLSEAQVIEHIELHHKAELIGIMSLYPLEWPYRMDNSYNDICGKNVAIDTDDLVLTNQNLSLVLGTYGKRPNWENHLTRHDTYHVCWPEYLILIELILAKKQVINHAITRYIAKSKSMSDEKVKQDKKRLREATRESIESNARLSIEISNNILQLNSIRHLRYVSHRHMFKMAETNLGVPTDERYLNDVIKRIDNSLNNANNNIELRQADKSNRQLFIISLASLIGVALQIIVPILSSKSTSWYNQALFVIITILVTGWVLHLIFKNQR